MISRKFAAIAAGLTLTLGLAACGGEGAGSGDDNNGGAANGEPSDLTVGVAMPTQTSER